MSSEERTVLLLISDAEVCKNVKAKIHAQSPTPTDVSSTGKDALLKLEAAPWQYDVVVIYDDLKEKSESLYILRKIKKNYHEKEIIYIMASVEKSKNDALHEGAFSCFFLPLNYEGIAYAVTFAREKAQFRRERKMLDKLEGLTASIIATEELETIIKKTCEAAVEIFEVSHSALVLFGKSLLKGKMLSQHPELPVVSKLEFGLEGPAEDELIKEQRSINIYDVPNSDILPNVNDILEKMQVKSILIIPVVLRGAVIAFFSLDMIGRHRIFYPDEVKLCKKLANRAAVAIGKARRLKELEVLNTIGNAISSDEPMDSDVKSTLKLIRTHAKDLLDVSNIFIALWDEEKELYSFPLYDNIDDLKDVRPDSLRRGLTDYVRRTKTALIADTSKIQELFEEGEIELLGTPARIWLGAPLIVRQRVLGVIVIQNYENEHAFNKHDLSILETIASLTASAVDSIRLFMDAKRRIHDLEIVNNIVHIMSTKLETDNLLQEMVTQISKSLGCSHCTLFFPETKKDRILLVPKKTFGLSARQILTRTFKPGEGLAGWVYQEGKSLVLPDARSDIRYSPSRKRKSRPHSMLVAPVKFGDRTIGVISAEQDEANWFSESDRQLVDTLARHIGIAIERALGLNLLQDIGLQIISTGEVEEILKQIITGATELTNTTSGMIYLISDDGKLVVKSYIFPSELKLPPPRMNKADGLTRLIIDKGEMIIVPDLSKDVRVNRELLKDVGSAIGVPLKTGKKVVGVLFLYDRGIRNFTETECSLLKTLANQAAITIYNSQLFRDSKRQLTELSALYETSQEIVGESMKIDVVLNKILERAVELSNADSGNILFPDASSNEIRVAYTYKIDALKGEKFKPGQSMASIVFKTGRAIYTNDYHEEAFRAPIFDKPKYRKLFKALAQIPFTWKGKVIGILAVCSNNCSFTEQSIQLLERFVRPAAIAISIAREIAFGQALLDNSPDAIVAVDASGIVKEFNKASEQIFKLDKLEIINKSVGLLWKETDESGRINRLLLDSETGTVRGEEAFVESSEGEIIPVLFSGSLLYSEIYGETIGSIVQIEDQRFVNLRGRTRKLFDAIEEINRTEELPKLLHVVLHWAIKLLEADSGYIMLKSAQGFEVVEKYNINEDKAEKIIISFKEELFGPLSKKGISHKVYNFPSDLPGTPISSDGKLGLVLLLKNELDIIGSVYLESHSNDLFREENELLQLLSNEAAVAINRVQLKEESKQLQRLKEIGDKIRVNGKFEKYKDMIVETSRQLLKSETSTIFLYDKFSRSFRRRAWNPVIENLDKFEEEYSNENNNKGITGQLLGYTEGGKDYIILSDEDKILKEARPGYLEMYKDFPSWKNEKSKSGESPIKHYLAVPIYGEKGKVFGALRVMNKLSRAGTEELPLLDDHGFRDPEDIELLKTIGSLLAQALTGERKANKLKMLHEITDEISSKTDIQGVADCIVQSIVNRFKYSACSMRLVRGDYLELIGRDGFKSNALKAMTLRKDRGFVGRAIQKKGAIVAHDIFSDDEKENGGYIHKRFAREENIRSACCVPIKGREDEIIGVITIYMRHAPYDFETYEVSDNFSPISATCSIALRKVQAVDHLQKLVDLLGLVHLETSKYEIIRACVDDMLAIFDAHSVIIYETKKLPDDDRYSQEKLIYEEIFTKNIEYSFEIPESLLLKIKTGGAQTLNANEFPKKWHAIKKQYSQCLIFALEFQDEILGMVMLFTEVGIPFILHEVDKYNLASAISRQLAIAFKNIEMTDELERMRVSQPAIISTQYVSGMIHELAASAHKGKAAATHVRGTEEYRAIKNITWKIEMGKIDAAFDDIGTFTTRALQIKDIGRMKFRKNLEYRSLNEAIQRVLYDTSYEARKKLANIKWKYDKAHNKKHAYFDGILIKQTIRNLISNSIKWIPDRGNGRISITSGEKGDYNYVRVEDNGIGIDKEITESIFEPFFTTSTTGYGIGLFFVRNVVKMHEGKVTLVSNKNPTIFEIQISSKLKKGGTVQ